MSSGTCTKIGAQLIEFGNPVGMALDYYVIFIDPCGLKCRCIFVAD